MTFDPDHSPHPPGFLKRLSTAVTLRAETFFWPFLEKMFLAMLHTLHKLSLLERGLVKIKFYFRVGSWLSFCATRSRRAHFAFWRSASRFPASGFSVRATPSSKAKLSLIISDVLNQADTPWFDPAAQPDLIWALRARARQLADHPARLFGAAATLDAIPASERVLEESFRLELETLCPGWADIELPASDMIGQHMLLDVNLRRSTERARKTQRSFIESRAMSAHLPQSAPSSVRSVRL